jgi:hypothetical protein
MLDLLYLTGECTDASANSRHQHSVTMLRPQDSHCTMARFFRRGPEKLPREACLRPVLKEGHHRTTLMSLQKKKLAQLVRISDSPLRAHACHDFFVEGDTQERQPHLPKRLKAKTSLGYVHYLRRRFVAALCHRSRLPQRHH